MKQPVDYLVTLFAYQRDIGVVVFGSAPFPFRKQCMVFREVGVVPTDPAMV